MSISKKSDVKNHLFPRLQTHLHLSPPESQLAVTGFITVESSESLAGPESFARDYWGEHSFSSTVLVTRASTVLVTGKPLTGSIGAQLSEASKSARA